METMKKIGTVIGKITKAVGCVSFVGVVVMMMLNVFDVLLNKIAGSPILGSYELTQRILMCTVFASFAYAQTKKTHINMTIIIAHFPRVLRFVLFTLMSVISVVACGALAYAAFLQGGVAMETNTMTEVLYIPLFPFFYIESLSMLIFMVALIYDTVLSACAIFSEDYAQLVMADWT